MADSLLYEAVPAGYQAPLWATILCRGVALILFLMIMSAAFNGHWLVVGVTAWFASHGLAIIFRGLIGGHSLREVFDPKTQSWAFLADVLLAVAIGALSYNLQFLDTQGWHTKARWIFPLLAGCYVLGVVAGYVWHNLLDRPNYENHGGGALLGDPWKIIHDLTTYTVYVATLVALLVIVMSYLVSWTQHWPALVMALIAAGIWAYGGMVHDAKGLDMFRLHDAFDWFTMQYRPGFRLRQL